MIKIKDIMKKHVQIYSDRVSRVLSLLHQAHGSDERLYESNLAYYEDLQSHLICVRELLDNQKELLLPNEIKSFKNAIIGTFNKQAMHIHDSILNVRSKSKQ